MSGETDEVAVLHVDDDEAFADLTAQYLERQPGNLTVDTAGGAEEALSMLASTAYDCIISDYDMPGRDGIDLLEAVRADHPDLPFILYTGKGSEGVASDAISAGVTDYVRKQPGGEQYAVLANRVRNAVDRFRARRRIRDSERQLSRVYERITDGFFAVDSDWEYTYVNEAGAALVGRDREELVGQTVWEAFPELVDSPFETALRSAMETGEPTSIEEYYPAHETWYDVSVYPDAEGISIYFRDVTERRQRERTLAQAETIFEHTQDAIFLIDVTDDGFRIERVNQAYVDITGLDRDALEGQPLADVVGEEYASDVERRYRECIEERAPIEYEEELPIGDVRYWQTKLAPVIEDGEVIQLVGATREITERKQREQELERYEAIVENSEDGIYVWNAEGYFEFVNQRVVEVSGIPREAWVGEHVSVHLDLETLSEAEVAEIEAGIDAILAGDTDDVRVELRPNTPSDVEVLELRLTSFDTDDDTAKAIGFTRDITDRKRSQERVERRNQRLDEFASVVSHDLRNPLNVAMGRLELAREGEDLAEQLDAIDGALGRMEALIENLLALAREGERVQELEAVVLADFADRCWATVETREATLDVVADAAIRADPEALQQLFENLFRNAVDHGGDDVTVTVGDVPGGFYVEDDGPGIDPGERADVFEAGYSTSAAGEGFGLSIVQGIVDGHGWTIEVVDGDAGGARFEISGVDVV